MFIKKSLDFDFYSKKLDDFTNDDRYIKLNENDILDSNCYNASCSVFTLPLLSKVFNNNLISTVLTKEKELNKTESLYCFSLNIELKNTNLDNKINYKIQNKNNLYLDVEKLFSDLKLNTNNDDNNLLNNKMLNIIRNKKGGLANYYVNNGKGLKSAFQTNMNFESESASESETDNSAIITSSNSEGSSYNSSSSNTSNSLDKSNNKNSKQDNKNNAKNTFKQGSTIQSILNSNYDKLSAEQFKELIDEIHDYGQKITLKYIIKNNKSDENLIVSSLIKDIAKNKSASSINDEISFLGSSKIQTKKFNKLSVGKSAKKEYNKKETPSILRSLSLLSLFLVLFFIGFVILDYVIRREKLNKIITLFSLLNLSLDALSEFQNAGLLVKDLILLNNPTYNHYIGNTIDNEAESLKSSKFRYIEDHLNYLKDIQNKLNYINQNFTVYNVESNSKINDLFTNSKTSIFKINNSSNGEYDRVLYTYLHAFKVQTSFLLYVQPSNIKEYDINNKNLMQFLHNNFNDFYLKTYTVSKLFSETIYYNLNNYQIILILFISTAFISYIILSILLSISIDKVILEKTKILDSFYKIPTFYVKYLSEMCGSFIVKLQRNNISNTSDSEDQENDLNNLDIEEIENNYSSEVNKRNYRSFTVKKLSIFNNLFSISLKLIIFVVYYTIIFAYCTIVLNCLQKINTIAIDYGQIYSNFTLSFNIIRQKIINPNEVFLSVNKLNDNQVNIYKDQWLKTKIISNEILNDITINSKYFSDEFSANLKSIYYDSICIHLTIDNNACSYKKDAISNYGLQKIIYNFMNIIDENFSYIYQNKIDNSIYNDAYYKDEDRFFDAWYLLWYYMRPAYSYIENNMFKDIKKNLENIQSLSIIMFISFIVIIIVGYMFFWLPYEYKLKEDVR